MNTQHNCAGNGCQVAALRKVFQERNEVSDLSAAIRHVNDDDIVLNIGQM